MCRLWHVRKGFVNQWEMRGLMAGGGVGQQNPLLWLQQRLLTTCGLAM